MERRGRPKKTESVMREIYKEVTGSTASEPVKSRVHIKSRMSQVDDLWCKGYKNDEIAAKLGLSMKQISNDLKEIRRIMDSKLIQSVESHRNRSRKRLDRIRKEAWDMAENLEAKSGARVAALRLVKEVEDLQTKVDGVVSEKMPAGPDKKAEELTRKLLKVAEGQGGNGHKDVEVSEIAHTD